MKQSATSVSTLLLITLCAIGSFLSFLDRRDIVTSHEARVAQTARQMAASGWPWNATPVEAPIVGMVIENGSKRLAPLAGAGTTRVNPWLVPTINGNIRLQKPPLPYWLTAIVYRIVGFNDQAARWWPAGLGAIATLIIADLAGLVFGRRAAPLAALAWVSTQFIVDEYRKSLADPYLAFATLLAVWMWLRASRSREHRRFAWLIGFYIAMAAGSLAKGPPLLLTVLPALFCAAIFLRARPKVRILWHIAGLVLFALLVFPWVIFVMRHVPHALEIWRYESVGEFGENTEKARPWWLYMLTCFQLPLPWVPMWLAGLTIAGIDVRQHGWRSPRARRQLFGIAWFAIVLVGFSFAHVKKNAYLLPIMPAQTLIVADGLRITLAFARRYKLQGLSGILLLAQCIIGIGFSIGLLVMSNRLQIDRSMTRLVCIAAVVFCLIALVPIVRQLPDAWLRLQTAAYVAGMVALLGFYRAADDNLRSPREFAREAIDYSNANQLPIATTQLPEEASVYMPMDYLYDNSESTNAPATSSSVLVMVDDNRLAIDRGLVTPDATFFKPYVADVPILGVRRIHLDHEERFLRWKLYELTIDRNRI